MMYVQWIFQSHDFSFLKTGKKTQLPWGFQPYGVFVCSFAAIGPRGLVSGFHSRGVEHLPAVMPGHFVTAAEPLEVGMDGIQP